MENKVRVVVVDNDDDARLYLQDAMQIAGDYDCVGSFSNGADALKEIPSLRPDLVLMAIQMPGLNGIECTQRLKYLMPTTRIIMVTRLHDEHSIESALSAGAVGLLIKPFTIEQCMATLLWTIASGTGSVSATPTMNLHLLTKRENEVMEFMAVGLLYKEIAEKLNISYSAVHKHQHNSFRKLHASNRTEASLLWANPD